ncbi:MAG: guanylate kinase [Verrucomicrobia bacterium]|nr:MAG: guanylate kinase [Verrucomicrobiota bacterium]MCX6883169.1 guanylate kinase [Verrucomicrobiota bacterium]
MHPSPSSGLLIVISAPSGGGKTTLCGQLLEHDPNIVRAITCTTREPRNGEKDGIDYFFLDASTFLKRVQAGHFLEHATVYGNSYGTLKSEVLGKLRRGNDVLLSVDVQGVATIKQQAAEDEELGSSLLAVFLAPQSISVLEERLTRRNQDSPAIIQKRLSVARQEITQSKHFDYILLSGTIAEDLSRMTSIILAEKLRQHRTELPSYN